MTVDGSTPERAWTDQAMPAHLRRGRELQLIRERGFVRVGELSRIFQISEVTVRLDLNRLAERGHIRRVRGGACPRSLRDAPAPPAEPQTSVEVAVARAAAALVSDGDRISLVAGRLTEAMAGALADRAELHDVVVVTNGLAVAAGLAAGKSRFTVVVTGGTLDPDEHALLDPYGDLLVPLMRTGTVFFDCEAVDAEAGVTTSHLRRAAMLTKMAATSRERVGLAHPDAIGRVSLARALSTDDLDALLTSRGGDVRALRELAEGGVAVNPVAVPDHPS